ncbi:MAG TPA: acyltransferase domain-containing protein, partial [Kofleriaceae bacterium]|nr:acyltransferase domain-containing protein [Kofleriaceae bacterium]
MGVELLESSSVFAASMVACGNALAPFVDWDLLTVVRAGSASPLWDRVDVVQPVLWAMMVSLAAVWKSLGVEPAAVVGHSQGEIAAAVVAGALTLADGARVVALRSQAIVALAGKGGMASIGEPVDAVRARIETWGDRLSVAAVNGPTSTVVSGEAAAIDALVAACEAAEVRARKIAVDYASHSREVEAIRDAVLEALAPIGPQVGTTAFYSTVSGSAPGTVTDATTLDAAYWYRNLRETVELAPTITALAAGGHHHFVEISPHAILRFALEETLGEAGVVLGTLRRDDGGMMRMLRSAGEAFTRGVAVDWAALFAGRTRDPRLVLPTYPFEHERFWFDAPARRGDARHLGLAVVEHPLLPAALDTASGTTIRTGRIALATQPWLAGHALHGTAVVPATAILELVLSSGEALVLDELTLHAPLRLPALGAIDVQLTLAGEGERTVHLYSRAADAGAGAAWTEHASGVVRPSPDAAGSDEAIAAWPPAAAPIDVDDLYDALAARGYEYGAAFRGVQAAWHAGARVFAEVALPDDTDATGFVVHPALLDAALQVASWPGFTPAPRAGELLLPFAWTGVRLHRTRATALRVQLTRTGDRIRVLACDLDGQPVLTADALVLRAVAADAIAAAAPTAGALFAIEWQAAAGEAGTAGEATVLAVPTGASVAHTTHHVLGALQAWLRAEHPGAARLVVVTERGVATAAGDPAPDPAHAAVWGLVRVAQSENP